MENQNEGQLNVVVFKLINTQEIIALENQDKMIKNPMFMMVQPQQGGGMNVGFALMNAHAENLDELYHTENFHSVVLIKYKANPRLAQAYMETLEKLRVERSGIVMPPKPQGLHLGR